MWKAVRPKPRGVRLARESVITCQIGEARQDEDKDEDEDEDEDAQSSLRVAGSIRASLGRN